MGINIIDAKKTATAKKMLSAVLILLCIFTVHTKIVHAGNVSGAIEGSWNEAKVQIKTVVNNVVFPALSMILAVLFFVKLGSAYFDYRRHGQFEFMAPLILFVCLLFTLSAKNYIWTIIP